MIAKLLVANRSEIARRIFRTCREMGIAAVAVYSDPDAAAPFVREADEAVPLGGDDAASSYLRADAVLEAARRAGADAVHPGYGFLSENADFAQRCIDAGLVWVGPPPSAVAAMGSKLTARDLMIDAGVPVLPGVDVSAAAPGELVHAGADVGYPLIVKAAFGGGGRGMRVVRDPAGLADAVAIARDEAEAAFGDDAVFVERYVERPRHIEVQVFADAHGSTVHLFERECSIQRRHQKIIEESPSPFVDEAGREALGAAAVRAAEAVGYVGAGTVEFIVDPAGGFYFLEMNTRLQVEHPVTEAITGLDLVRLQIEVAAGSALPPAVRDATRTGHAIEARVYAEDPADDHRPVPGVIERFDVPGGPGIRVDRGVEAGDEISVFYDPMIAKVVAHADTRDEARRRLARALRAAHIHHPATNRDLLVAVLEHPEFAAGELDTAFLDRHPPGALVADALTDEELRLAAVVAALASSAAARAGATVLAAVPSGWRNNRSQLAERTFAHERGTFTVGYALGRDGRIEVDGDPITVDLVSLAPDEVVLVAEGVRRTWSVAEAGGLVHVDGSRASATLRPLPRFRAPADEVAAGSLQAPMPGTVVRVDVAPGDQVDARQVLVVIEAMKMQHQIGAPAAGVVAEVRVRPGETVDAGAVLVVLDDGAGDG